MSDDMAARGTREASVRINLSLPDTYCRAARNFSVGTKSCSWNRDSRRAWLVAKGVGIMGVVFIVGFFWGLR